MKWLKRLLFVVAFLVALYGLFVAVENWRGKHAWDTYQREREVKGDSFDWKVVAPPPVSDAENFAMTPLFAELFPKPPEHPRLQALRLPDPEGPSGDWRIGRVENLAAWRTALTNDDLLAALKPNEPILREIAEALRERPKCRFPIRYEDSFKALLPHFVRLRGLARVYRLRALAELSAGRTEAAFEDVRLCLRLADTIKDEPLLISLLVRISVLNIVSQPVWEGLAAHRWNERQLEALQIEFSHVDQLAGLANATRGERLFAYSIVRWLLTQPMRERDKVINDPFDSSTTPVLTAILATVPAGWYYQNGLTVDSFYTERFLPSLDLEQRCINPRKMRLIDDEMKATRKTPFNILFAMLAPSVTAIAKKTAQSQTGVDEVVVACALERYRLAKGEYPENLAALVPEFLAKIPTDVIDGKPLRYRRDASDKFTLWSIGWNEIDDGGKVVLYDSKPPQQDFDKGDWVWQSWVTP